MVEETSTVLQRALPCERRVEIPVCPSQRNKVVSEQTAAIAGEVCLARSRVSRDLLESLPIADVRLQDFSVQYHEYRIWD